MQALDIPLNQIINADALAGLAMIPSSRVDMCLTSPPYFNLRDYGQEGQIGLESTPEEYINKLVSIFAAVHRVLKPTGSLWVNLGDTYAGQKVGNTNGTNGTVKQKEGINDFVFTKKKQKTIPDKSLMLIPFRFAIAMQNRGWILRNVIIWDKPNPMPSSAKDRFTVSHEYVFFFTKSQRYYFDTQYEPFVTDFQPGIKFGGNKAKGYGNPVYSGNEYFQSELGRIMRSVWRISTKPYKEAHFATFPEALCETPIAACCPQFVCTNCGKARQTIYNEKRINQRPGNDTGNGKSGKEDDPNADLHNSDLSKYKQRIIRVRKSLSECGCHVGYRRGICLDPFFGAGTTGLVALKQDKCFIGIELNKKYCELAQKRLQPYLDQKRLIDFS